MGAKTSSPKYTEHLYGNQSLVFVPHMVEGPAWEQRHTHVVIIAAGYHDLKRQFSR